MMEIVLLKGLLFAGGILLVLWLLTILQARWTKEAYDFKDKHVYITGGSSGLGRAVAMSVLKKGAHITVVARTESTLLETVAELRKHRLNQDQRVHYCVADVTQATASESAFQMAIEKHDGHGVDCVFLCAGAAQPGFFTAQTPRHLEDGMRLNYLGSAYTAQIAAKHFIKTQARHAKIVFTSSTLGLMTLLGYSQYAPAKHAIRAGALDVALAEVLRQELLPHGIGVHVYFVSTIASAGYLEEERSKPAITKRIEGSETSDPSPLVRAHTLLLGILADRFMITSDLVTDLFRCKAQGMAPFNSLWLDLPKKLVAEIVLPFWRLYADHLVLGSHKAQQSCDPLKGPGAPIEPKSQQELDAQEEHLQ